MSCPVFICSPRDLPFLAVSATANLTIQAQVLPTGDYVNFAEILGQACADPDSKPDNMGAAPSEDDEASASILAYLSGNIFIDNGIGGGTAHDGSLNGGEVPANVGTLMVTESATGAQLTSTTVNAYGTWLAVLPDGFSGELIFTVVPNAGYRVISEGTSTLPAVVNPDGTDGTFRFTPTNASRYTNTDFGLIRKPTLTQNQAGAIVPGQVAELPHVYTATTSGSVAFSILNEVQNCLHDLGRACTSPVVVAPGITYTLQLPATGNATGYAGALEWSCPGQFPPSTEGSLTFQVQISP